MADLNALTKIINDYSDNFNATMESNPIQQMAMSSDSTTLTSMNKNIGWSSNPDFGQENLINGELFDIVFGVVIVIKEHDGLLKACTEEMKQTDEDLIDLYYRTLYGASINRLRIWMDIAIQTWQGEYDISTITPIPDHLVLPPQAGTSVISIWGNMLDKQGRAPSVLVTDQSNPLLMLRRMPYILHMWQATNDMGYGVQYNKWGDQTYKERNTYLPHKRAASKKAPKKKTPAKITKATKTTKTTKTTKPAGKTPSTPKSPKTPSLSKPSKPSIVKSNVPNGDKKTTGTKKPTLPTKPKE